MSAIDDKLQQCRRALDDVREMRSRQDVPKLLARFTAYVNHVSAVRQYAQNELKNLKSPTAHSEQQWLQALEDSLDFAAVMGLRHVDQHTEAIRVNRQLVKMQVNEVIRVPTSSVKMVLRDIYGNIKAESTTSEAVSSENESSTSTATELNYYCDASTLPGFMTAQQRFPKGFSRTPGQGPVLAKGDDLPLKAAVTAYLDRTDMLAVAERSYSTLAGTSDGWGCEWMLHSGSTSCDDGERMEAWYRAGVFGKRCKEMPMVTSWIKVDKG